PGPVGGGVDRSFCIAKSPGGWPAKSGEPPGGESGCAISGAPGLSLVAAAQAHTKLTGRIHVQRRIIGPPCQRAGGPPWSLSSSPGLTLLSILVDTPRSFGSLAIREPDPQLCALASQRVCSFGKGSSLAAAPTMDRALVCCQQIFFINQRTAYIYIEIT